MTIHFSHHASREGWTSFETDPRLRRTKERLHQRCLPCLTALLEQLKGEPGRVDLGLAWNCWKVVAVMDSHDACLELLAQFADHHPEAYVYGKLGTGKGRETVAVMFHTEESARRDQLFGMLSRLVARHFPGASVFYSRACGDPYERLFGAWQSWSEICPLRHPERIVQVKADLRESLYGRS